MAHERETWLDHAVAELLLRGSPVETADIRAQVRADRLAGVLAEAARAAYAGENAAVGAPGAAASGELPGEAAALAAFRQAVGTAGRTAPSDQDVNTEADTDGIGTVRLGPERLGGRIPRYGRPLRLGLAAAMVGCALSGVAAGAGYLYAPSAGESPPRPANSVSDAVTPEPLVSDSPSDSGPPATPDGTPGGADAGSLVPGATGIGTGPGPSGGPADKRGGEKARTSSGSGWKDGDGEKWYAMLVKACHEYRNGAIAAGKRKLLEGAAKGPQGVPRFCDQLLSDGPDRGGHDEGANGSGGGGWPGPGGGDGPPSGGPAEGGIGGGSVGGGSGDGGGSDGGGSGGSGGSDGSDGGSAGPPSEWPGGDYGETIGMNPPTPEGEGAGGAGDTGGANLPPLLPAMPGGDAAPDPAPGTETGDGAGEPAVPTPAPELPTP